MKELVAQLIESIRKDIIADQQEKRIRASGKSADSLHAENVSDKGGELTGVEYIFTQITGKPPGEEVDTTDIKKWIQNKGIQIKDASEDSVAFFIARKIKQFGTDIFLGKRPGLDFDLIVEHNVKEFSELLIKELENNILEEVYNKYKGAQ